MGIARVSLKLICSTPELTEELGKRFEAAASVLDQRKTWMPAKKDPKKQKSEKKKMETEKKSEKKKGSKKESDSNGKKKKRKRRHKATEEVSIHGGVSGG